MSIFKKVLSLTFAVLLLAGCGGGSGDSSDDSESSVTTVSGSFVIPNTAVSPSVTSSRAIEDLSGSVIVTIGNSQVVIPASNITLNAENNYLVRFSKNVNIDGIIVITCTSALVAGTEPIEYSGYNMTTITAGEDNDINGNNSSATLTEVDLSGFTATASPTFTSFEVTEPLEGALITTFNATISQLESDLVYLRVNNAYQPLSVYVGYTGSATISDSSISLVPGENKVQLFAVNSQGFTASPTRTVYCTAENLEGSENFLFTLTWDNLSDIDLHTFYYSTTPSEGTATPDWHTYFGSRNHPNDDAIINNLDIDNTRGYGPEHFTLLGAPDGYYIVAINAYRIDYTVDTVNAFVTVQATASNKSYGPFGFSMGDGMDDIAFMNESDSWYRVADIEVTDGVATIRRPDMDIIPCSGTYYYSMRSAAGFKK